MNILLDTHILVWLLTEDPKLPEKVIEMTTSGENKIFFSTISMWEVAIKRMAHPDKITKRTPKELVDFCYESKIYELPLKLKHVYALETLMRPEDSPAHKDPFDRILISQAKSENMTFITHDGTLSAYSEPCILYV